MDIWEVLAIERTNNVKEIKQAYAKKLKFTRPDEHPEKFQELHLAYKTAIDQSKCEWQGAEIINEIQDNSFLSDDRAQESGTEEKYFHEDENLAISSVSLQKTDPHESEDKYQIEISRFVESAQILLNTETKFNEIESWQFLMDSPYVLDTDFNWRLSMAILQLLGEHNKNNYAHQIKSELISYLNDIFNWDANSDYINSLLGSDVITDLLNKISDVHNTKKLSGLRGAVSVKFETPSMHQFSVMPHATIVIRFFAFSIDILILISLFSLMLFAQIFDMRSIHLGYFTALLLLISAAYFFLFEISLLHASPGKMALGLIVTNQFYEPISIIQALLRTVSVFLAIAVVVSLVFYANSGFHLGVSLGLCFLALRALLFLFSNPEDTILINDTLSKSFVFDLRKARLEHSNQL